MVARAKLRLATASDLARIYSDIGAGVLGLDLGVHHQLPPPGLELVYDPLETENDPGVALPYIWGEVRGDWSSLNPGDLYWTTFAEYAAGVVGLPTEPFHLGVLSAALLLTPFPGSALSYPIVYEVGKGATMRWISSTFRGSLGGVEEFAYKLDWGKPGDDPDWDVATQLAFAEELAGYITTVMGTSTAAMWSTDIKWVEVGVCSKTQTDPTDKDGKGGNLEQADPTQWSAYALASQPVGTAASPSLPYEVACAVTLLSDTRGARGRGRCYLPPFSTGAMAVGGVYSSGAPGLASRIVTDVYDHVDAGTTDVVPVVVSRRAIQLHPVTNVLVGKVPDSQRRRRRSQDEARSHVWPA